MCDTLSFSTLKLVLGSWELGRLTIASKATDRPSSRLHAATCVVDAVRSIRTATERLEVHAAIAWCDPWCMDPAEDTLGLVSSEPTDPSQHARLTPTDPSQHGGFFLTSTGAEGAKGAEAAALKALVNAR